MTYEQLVQKLDNWWAAWGTSSNATSNPTELLEIGESDGIAEIKQIIKDAGGHPDPPPPRIRP